jgi:hypothetical protein
MEYNFEVLYSHKKLTIDSKSIFSRRYYRLKSVIIEYVEFRRRFGGSLVVILMDERED